MISCLITDLNLNQHNQQNIRDEFLWFQNEVLRLLQLLLRFQCRALAERCPKSRWISGEGNGVARFGRNGKVLELSLIDASRELEGIIHD